MQRQKCFLEHYGTITQIRIHFHQVGTISRSKGALNPTWPGGGGKNCPPVDFFPGAGKLFECGKKFFLTFSEIILEGKIQKNPPQKIFPAATVAAASAAPKKTQNL